MGIPDPVLFTGTGGTIAAAQITTSLKAIGIAEGDVVYVHSDLVRFGRIAPSMLSDREAFFGAIEAAMLDAIGPSGTLLMPTFTTGAFKTHHFSRAESPSETGALTEHFRRRAGVSRTLHPTHSAAVVGAKTSLFQDPPPDPFGVGSTFDVLTKAGGKVVLLGADFHWCTYVHHIESMARVRYRTPRMVDVDLDDGQGARRVQAVRFTRPARYWPDFHRFEKILQDRGIHRSTSLGAGEVASIDCRSMLRAGLEALEHDALLFYRVHSYGAQLIFDLKGLAGRLLRYVRR